LITQALSKLGINLSTSSDFSASMSYQISEDTSSSAISQFGPLGNEGIETNQGFQLPPLNNFELSGFNISSEMLDAFSSLEPIDATVGSLRDFD
jgi:hypothetical protein